jgi:predicted small metal-binding protein
MAKQINCDDGAIIRGANDEELLANAHEHMRQAHPDLATTLTDEQLLAMAVEV